MRVDESVIAMTMDRTGNQSKLDTERDSVSGAGVDKSRPLVLLTNDDGYGTDGIEAMAEALGQWARVVVIAPNDEQSACSHKLTLAYPLTFMRVGEGRYRVNGTPADCVYLGVYGAGRLLGEQAELVVSGLNAGPNLGLDTHYSGTVAGAREAAIRGIAGLAVSADVAADLTRAAQLCSQFARCLWQAARQRTPEQRPPLVNMNVPSKGPWKLCRTRLGWRTYGEGVDFRRDPRGREYLWLGGPGGINDDLSPGTDTLAYREGNVSITYLPLVPQEQESDGWVDALINKVEGHTDGA